MRLFYRYPTSSDHFYAENLEWMVNFRYLTKILFAFMFLTFAFISMIFTLMSAFKHGETTWYWSVITILTAIMSGCVAASPTNRRRLIFPSALATEISVKDYFWLIEMCKQFAPIHKDAKELLAKNGAINYADFERIWITLGEYKTIQEIEKQTQQQWHSSKSNNFIDIAKIKKQILAL